MFNSAASIFLFSTPHQGEPWKIQTVCHCYEHLQCLSTR